MYIYVHQNTQPKWLRFSENLFEVYLIFPCSTMAEVLVDSNAPWLNHVRCGEGVHRMLTTGCEICQPFSVYESLGLCPCLAPVFAEWGTWGRTFHTKVSPAALSMILACFSVRMAKSVHTRTCRLYMVYTTTILRNLTVGTVMPQPLVSVLATFLLELYSFRKTANKLILSKGRATPKGTATAFTMLWGSDRYSS